MSNLRRVLVCTLNYVVAPFLSLPILLVTNGQLFAAGLLGQGSELIYGRVGEAGLHPHSPCMAEKKEKGRCTQTEWG